MVLGINVGILAKVVNLAEPTDSITLSADNNPTHLKLISPGVDHLTIPATEYSSVAAMAVLMGD